MRLRTWDALVVLLTMSAACGPPEEPRLVLGGPSPAAMPPSTVEIAVPAPVEPEPPPPPPSPPQKVAGPTSGDPKLDVVRDRRRSRSAPRARALLVTELQGLESLFTAMPSTAPDRPVLIRRLADTYAELEASALRDKALGADSDPARPDRIIVASRNQAIKHYLQLENLHPKWCAYQNTADPSKSTGCADEALYHLGYESELAGRLDEARKAYFELIQSWPQSRLIPDAYLAFGEMFFREAQTDPSKLQLAQQSYLEVIKYPPPGNEVLGYAHYQLAHVYAKLGEPSRAKRELKNALAWASAHPSAVGALELRDAALRALDGVGGP